MSTAAYALRDTKTLLLRNLTHARRYPMMLFATITLPVLMLLLFVYVFGGALGDGIEVAGLGTGRRGYADYVAPGILVMAVTSGAIAVSVSVCSDMTQGIVNRFRTMAIWRPAVLAGHVVGNVVMTMVSLLAVLAVALLVGFRPHAGVEQWLAALGLLVLLCLALSWLSAAIGVASKTVESASNTPMPIQFLPFLGSAIVPTASMPTAMRWFGQYQPFTPVNETLRGLLTGTRIGDDGLISVAWCIGITVLGYLWSRAAFAKLASS